MNKSFPKSRILIKDNSGKTYRLCSFYHEPMNGGKFDGEFYLKFMFPDLLNKNLKNVSVKDGALKNGQLGKMNEISFHYKDGVITQKHQGKNSSDKIQTQKPLEEKGFLFLITLKIKNLKWTSEFIKKKTQHDIFLENWNEKPRGLQFILHNRDDLELVVNREIISQPFGFRDEKTGLYLTFLQYYLDEKEIPKGSLSILVHTGGSEEKLIRLTK